MEVAVKGGGGFKGEGFGADFQGDPGMPGCVDGLNRIAGGAKVVAEGFSLLREDVVEEGVEARWVEAELCETWGEL